MTIEKIENYTKPATVNPFLADMEGLAEGDAFAVRFTPTRREIKDENGEGTGEFKLSTAGSKSQVQDAARAKGLTAREAERSDVGDGTIRVVFTLHKAQKSGPRVKTDESTDESTDAPAEKPARRK